MGLTIMLKFKIKKLDDVEEALRAFYEEKSENGETQFYLKVDGAVDRDRLSEFRTNNIALKKELDALKKQYEGIDLTPEELRELVQKADDIRSTTLFKKDKVDELVTERTKAIVDKHTKENAKLAEERNRYLAELSEIKISQAAVTAATKRGLRTSAIPDLGARAKTIFKLIDGKATAVEADGQTPRYGKDGVTVLTIDEWVDGLTADAPHLFESSSGGGASGGSGGASSHGTLTRNPWKRETWNLTEQMRVSKADPKTAARLKAEAGKR